MSFRNYLWHKIKEYDWFTTKIITAALLGSTGIIALPTWLASVIFGGVIAVCVGLLIGLISAISVLVLIINYFEYLEQRDTSSNETVGSDKK